MPDEQRRWLDDALADTRAGITPARWIPVANQHITVRFLGSVDEQRLPDIGEVVRECAVAQRPGDVRLDGLGAFPSRRKARVLWAGLSDPADVLSSLARALDEGLAASGFPSENRAFTAHLTLARLPSPRDVSALWPEDLPAAALGSWTVDSVGLWRSHLSPKGARYEVLSSEYFGRP